jgi:hypothetical protein
MALTPPEAAFGGGTVGRIGVCIGKGSNLGSSSHNSSPGIGQQSKRISYQNLDPLTIVGHLSVKLLHKIF